MDISGCSTTDELLDAAVMKAGFKIDPNLRSLWMVCIMEQLFYVLLTLHVRYQNLTNGPLPKKLLFTKI